MLSELEMEKINLCTFGKPIRTVELKKKETNFWFRSLHKAYVEKVLHEKRACRKNPFVTP